jgi:hypothetical protein
MKNYKCERKKNYNYFNNDVIRTTYFYSRKEL